MKPAKPKLPAHGGARSGAGRKAGSSPYGESTRVMRVPESLAGAIEEALSARKAQRLENRFRNDILLPAMDCRPIRAPLFGYKIPAGFPSPADDYIEGRLSLDEHLIRHREATFFVRAKGNSMTGAGIFDGDLLVVDKSLEPSSGDIVIAVIDGELTVKRLVNRSGKTILKPENPRFKEIELKDGQELQVWGVVTSSVKKFA